LKRPRRGHLIIAKRVAPFTGAWIETYQSVYIPSAPLVAPFTGAWIETRRNFGTWYRRDGRPLHGGVD